MLSPRVGIIIPVYNGEKFIEQAIRSLDALEFRNFVAVIVDDGSTDNTLRAANELVHGKPEYVVVSKNNGGISSTRNTGLEKVKNVEFIQFLDHDDLLLPDKLSWQVEYLDSHPECVGVLGQADYFVESASSVTGGIRPSLEEWAKSKNAREYNTIPINSVLVRNLGIRFDASLETHEDWDFWLQATRHGRLEFVERVCCRVRVHSSSMSNDFTRMEMGRSVVFLRYAKGPIDWLRAQRRLLLSLSRCEYDSSQLKALAFRDRAITAVLGALMRPFLGLRADESKHSRV